MTAPGFPHFNTSGMEKCFIIEEYHTGSIVFTAWLKPLFIDSILASVKYMVLMQEATLKFGASLNQHFGGSFLQSRVCKQRQTVDSQTEKDPG